MQRQIDFTNIWRGLSLQQGFWSFVDQVIVSVGTFFSFVILARDLEPYSYGVFTLLFSAALTLQLVISAILYHPMAIKLSVSPQDQTPILLAESIILTICLSLFLALCFAVGITLSGKGYLALPAMAWFVSWQVQEGLRRGLISLFRHKDAILGDAFSYLGRALFIFVLSACNNLSVAGALWGMAFTSLLAAGLQWRQLAPAISAKLDIKATAIDYWGVGGGNALGSGLTSHFRTQLVPWVLAFVSGPAAAGAFQAVTNLINLLNPIIIGLGNILPQVVSRAAREGRLAAWRAAKEYYFLAIPVILSYAVVVFLAPDLLLSLLYGAGSPYVELSWTARLLICAAVLMYIADMSIWYLHGIAEVRGAFLINFTSLLLGIVLVVPLVYVHGLLGGCVALLATNFVRILISRAVMRRYL